MTERIRVGLLFGGASVEHEVSVVSARGVLEALDPARFTCIPLAVTGEGRWLARERSARILTSDARRVESALGADDGGRLVAEPGGGIVELHPRGGHSRVDLDVVFSVVHGWGGEDGRIQGLLDLAGVPYVGAGVLGSAVGMDKEAAKRILESRGIPVVPWISLLREEYRSDPAGVVERISTRLSFPLFVKPANGGSSVGVSRVAEPVSLPGALDQAFACDRKAVVESGIDAREIECAVLGNDRPEASIPGEIVPSREFYDYAAKYLDGTSQLRIPAPLPPSTVATVRRLAVEVFRALNLEGMARVDFFVERATDRVFANEANTLPGFTPISMYPKLWEASGLPYSELLDRLIRLALERARSENTRVSRFVG